MVSGTLDGHEACARLLLERGADANQAKSDGTTALMWACQSGHEACARTLIDAEGSLEAVSKAGHTALALARAGGHAALCTLLEG